MLAHRTLPPVAANSGRTGGTESSAKNAASARRDASLAAAIAARRAEIRAELATAPPPDWAALEAKAARSQRALDAQRSAQRTKNPRASRPAPTPTGFYAQPISLNPVHDERLTRSAVCVLVELRARLMTGASTMKAALAAALHMSTRTVQRCLAALEGAGYIGREAIRTAMGWQIGQTIRLLAAALPPFLRKTPKNPGFSGETAPSPYKDNFHNSKGIGDRIHLMVYAITRPPPKASPG